MILSFLFWPRERYHDFYVEMVMRELKKELWPYKVVLQRKKDGDDGVTNKEIWLGTHLGTYRGRWNIVFRPSEIHFYFKEGADATMFALRWS